MTVKTTDGLGRATFQHIERRTDVRPTEREIRWFKHIERHGPQSSEFLFELTRDTHRSKDTALRDMQKLRASGFLGLPRQQRATERAEFKPYIYDLTKLTRDYLAGLSAAERTVRPTGHWWHGYNVSAFTGTLDIYYRRKGCEYIPAHRILERSRAPLAVPVGGTQLIPDQLFAVGYPDGYRAYMLEVDRATEPYRSNAARKSLTRAVDLYTAALSDNRARRHYGIRAGLTVLWVFSSPGRMNAFRELVQKRAGRLADHFLSKKLADRISWAGLVEVHNTPWVSGRGKAPKGL